MLRSIGLPELLVLVVLGIPIAIVVIVLVVLAAVRSSNARDRNSPPVFAAGNAFCTKCGTGLAPAAMFCDRCGTRRGP
jgi:hypothetical protein